MASFRPELFGDFLLVQRLAQSAMAEALVGVRLGDRSGRTFVIKRPALGERASGGAAQAIRREAEVLEAVRAPGLAALEAAGEIAGLPYVATEHVRGVALDALLARGPLPEPMAAAIAADLAETLARLHDGGWVHGDVTPSNVVVDDAGEARLVDLGLAERAGATPAALAGKPGYIAPEAVRGVAVAPALDVYAWGAVIAECTLGERLHAEVDLADAAKRSELSPDRLPIGLHDGAVLDALRRDAGARPSARAIAARLAPLARDRTGLAERVASALASDDAPTHGEGLPGRPSAPANTPTTPMTAPRPAPTLVDVPEEDAGSITAAPRFATRQRVAANIGRPASLGPFVVIVGAALILGLAALRLARPRHATLALASSLPKRSLVEIDGRPTLAPDVGGTLDLPPGRHLVTLVLPRNDRREYSIDVRAGDRILVFPLLRGSAGAAYEGRDP